MSTFRSEIPFALPPRVFWPLLGLGIVLSSAIVTFLASRLPLFLPSLFYVYSSLAALLAGVPLWWLLIVLPRRATIRRGLLVGILGSVLAHPLMFMIAALISIVGYIPDGVVEGQAVGDLLLYAVRDSLLSVVVFPIYSLVFVG